MTDPVLIQMLAGSLHYNAQRQSVLAKNISNIDTPRFQAQDIKKPDFARLAESSGRQLQVRTTAGQHLSGTLGDAAFRADKLRKPYEMTPVNNTVSLEEQMAKISDTTTQYQLTTTMLKKYTGLYRTALDNRGG